jgi:leucyl-tRNA synthetase
MDADELQIREQVLADEKIGRHIGESKIKRFIVVPQKLVNVVI